MKECHVCFYVCGDDDEICPVCGAQLSAEEPETAAAELKEPEEADYINNPVLAASVDSPVTAEIYKDILSENGISYSEDTRGDTMHTGFGGSFFAVDIYVDEDSLDIAKDLYRNLTESDMGFFDFEDEDGE